MVVTRRITTLLDLEKITAFQKLDLLLSSGAEVGRGLFLLTGPRGRGPTT
jgi:type II secretory ATPase GspE/PulE/Tfp pilus assembly ATPase PilB-like protein